MKIPRDLSGRDVVSLLCRNWGYRVIHQEGSHIVLETENRRTSGLLFLLTRTFVSVR
jgi:predicted RNA binding protein YcfA (HicA-like mRNA interferase family)